MIVETLIASKLFMLKYRKLDASYRFGQSDLITKINLAYTFSKQKF